MTLGIKHRASTLVKRVNVKNVKKLLESGSLATAEDNIINVHCERRSYQHPDPGPFPVCSAAGVRVGEIVSRMQQQQGLQCQSEIYEHFGACWMKMDRGGKKNPPRLKIPKSKYSLF